MVTPDLLLPNQFFARRLDAIVCDLQGFLSANVGNPGFLGLLDEPRIFGLLAEQVRRELGSRLVCRLNGLQLGRLAQSVQFKQNVAAEQRQRNEQQRDRMGKETGGGKGREAAAV